MDQAAREAIRQRRLTVSCLLGCGALAAGVAVAAVAAALWLIPIRPDLGPLPGEGARIADRVEAYRAAHGAYPPDLDAAGASPRTGRYGGWQYEVYADGTGFRLSIGRYGEDGFVLAYASDGGWYSDT
jgi:hypothetical protein